MTTTVREITSEPLLSIRACELNGTHIGHRIMVDISADLTITDTLVGVIHDEEQTRVSFKNAAPVDTFGPSFRVPATARVVIL